MSTSTSSTGLNPTLEITDRDINLLSSLESFLIARASSPYYSTHKHLMLDYARSIERLKTSLATIAVFNPVSLSELFNKIDL